MDEQTGFAPVDSQEWGAAHWARRHGIGRFFTGPPGKRGPLRRQQSDRLIGGVAAGVSARTGLDVTAVRTAFVLAALLSGFGVAAYVLAWLLLPADGEAGSIASRAKTDGGGIVLAAAAVSVIIAVLVIVSMLGAGWLASFSWLPAISVAGIVLIWRNASAQEKVTLGRLVEPFAKVTGADGRSRILWRVSVAGLLLVSGLVILLKLHARLALAPALGGVLLVIGAIVVMFGPWWLRIARDLVLERQARVRAEERADMAAIVHDSVLQTLALIQRRADNPQQVIQLARAQERELRSWLFDARAPGSLDGQATTIAEGVRRIQQDVEAQHGISVEAITVGDCELDEDLGALLAAAREATINAAKWSGAPVVSLFAEVESAEVGLFVRDRGRGFDPDAVPADRKGLAESIRARVARRGGSATIKSAPGQGTEVSLTMPRTAGQREPSRTK